MEKSIGIYNNIFDNVTGVIANNMHYLIFSHNFHVENTNILPVDRHKGAQISLISAAARSNRERGFKHLNGTFYWCLFQLFGNGAMIWLVSANIIN